MLDMQGDFTNVNFDERFSPFLGTSSPVRSPQKSRLENSSPSKTCLDNKVFTNSSKKAIRSARCAYCGIKLRTLETQLSHYWLHFIIADFRDQNSELDTSPENLLQLNEFQIFASRVPLPIWAANLSDHFVRSLSSAASKLGVSELSKILNNFKVFNTDLKNNFDFFPALAKPWLYRKWSLKESLEEALLKCRITSCNFETVNPTELCFHYEVHSAISRIKDTDLEHQIIEFLPDGRHHPVFNDRLTRDFLNPHWRSLNNALKVGSIKDPPDWPWNTRERTFDENSTNRPITWAEAIDDFLDPDLKLKVHPIRRHLNSHELELSDLANLTNENEEIKQFAEKCSQLKDSNNFYLEKEEIIESSIKTGTESLEFDQNSNENSKSSRSVQILSENFEIRRKNDEFTILPESPKSLAKNEKIFCNLCTINEFQDFLDEEDLEDHKRLWHNDKYSAEECSKCRYRALEIGDFRNNHTKQKCREWKDSQIYINLSIRHSGRRSGKRSSTSPGRASKRRKLKP